jgi:hypothetical protein
MISPELLDEIRARVSLVDSVAAHVPLRKHGREHIGLCPFHSERTSSFYVYSNHYHCYGCGAHGDVVDFVMRVSAVNFPVAVERLRGDAGITGEPSPERIAELQQQRQQREKRAAAERAEDEAEALALWQQCGPAAGTIADDYYRSRGITIAAPRSLRFNPALSYYGPDPDNPKRSKLLGTFPAVIGAVQAPMVAWSEFTGRISEPMAVTRRPCRRRKRCRRRVGAARCGSPRRRRRWRSERVSKPV